MATASTALTRASPTCALRWNRSRFRPSASPRACHRETTSEPEPTMKPSAVSYLYTRPSDPFTIRYPGTERSNWTEMCREQFDLQPTQLALLVMIVAYQDAT